MGWREHLQLPEALVLASDFNREFGRSYELLTTNPAGMRDILRRTVFVIRPDGRLAYRWDVSDPPTLPKVDEVLEAVRKL